MSGNIEERFSDLLEAISNWSKHENAMRLFKNPKKPIFKRDINWEYVQTNMIEMGYTDIDIDEIKRNFSIACNVVGCEKPLLDILDEASSHTFDIASKERASGYQLFASQKIKILNKKNPNMAKSEIFKKVAKDWNSLAKSNKDKYNAKASNLNKDMGFNKESKMLDAKLKLEHIKLPPLNILEFYRDKYVIPNVNPEDIDPQSSLDIRRQIKEDFSKFNSSKMSTLENEYNETKKRFVMEFEKMDNIEKQIIKGNYLKKKYITAFVKDPILGYIFNDNIEKPSFNFQDGTTLDFKEMLEAAEEDSDASDDKQKSSSEDISDAPTADDE